MKYELIIEKGDYAVIRRGEDFKEFAVVYNLDKEHGCWSHTCGIYPYESMLCHTRTEAEALSGALNEFRDKTEENYYPIQQIELRRTDFLEDSFILDLLGLEEEDVGDAVGIFARVNPDTLATVREGK